MLSKYVNQNMLSKIRNNLILRLRKYIELKGEHVEQLCPILSGKGRCGRIHFNQAIQLIKQVESCVASA